MTVDGLRATSEEIWQEVLQEDIDDDTNFFDHGGFSFAALRIIAMLNEQYDKQAPVQVLFDNPRFGDFVAALGREMGIGP